MINLVDLSNTSTNINVREIIEDELKSVCNLLDSIESNTITESQCKLKCQYILDLNTMLLTLYIDEECKETMDEINFILEEILDEYE